MNEMSAPGLDAKIASSVATCRETLNKGFERLVHAYHEKPLTGPMLKGRAELVDGVLQTLWQSFGMPASAVLMAAGGYGRNELYPHSDVDILILLPEEEDLELRGKISGLITALWDIGLEIGHSVRTVEECIEESAQDITVQTNMLESRRLAGPVALYDHFRSVLLANLSVPRFFKAKRAEQEQRYARYEDTPYSLEPNSKESPGGLRDLQMLVWISIAAGLGHGWRELVRHKLINPGEARELREVERFLQHVRIRLHLLAGRREDRLLFDYQESLAAALGYSAQAGKRASEVFMQQYYINAKKVTQLNTVLLLNFAEEFLDDRQLPAVVIDDDFQAVRELLDIRHDRVFAENPSSLLRCFLVMQQRSELKGMTARTLRALWQNRNRINAEFRANPENRALFVELLQQRRGIVSEFRRMNQYGILSRYLPPWNKILCQMQHDLFHVYTVDQHSLMVLRNLRRFTMAEHAHEYPLMTRLMFGMDRHWLLYVAALFHDIAKGRGGDHSRLGMIDAQQFCVNHEFDREDSDLVVWLVGQHLTMSHVAQKQDIGDPEVISRFAAVVVDERHLTALYLLSHADIRGTSPKVWNGWKAKLLEDLFHATRRLLRGATPQQALGVDDRVDEARRQLRYHGLRADIEKPFWKNLDQLYFLRHSPDEIAWHTRQLYHRPDPPAPVVKARLVESGDAIQVMVYTPDVPDLFKRICGSIARLGFTILDAKIHTTRHGYALDSFMVQNPEDATHYRDVISLIEHELADRLVNPRGTERPSAGRLSRKLRHFPITPRVDIRADEGGRNFIISISAVDRPYLLYDVAELLGAHGISLHSAKIATLGERVEDTFLVSGGGLSTDSIVLKVKQQLQEKLQL
ncbi:MAG: [protein-PII] uridylyltransferase [Rhodocyclaceae bacterium]|nr:[protein-PII] uridylyltransferase [Rhodocyclaceae bacterium]MCB1901928.1 [protein-PII] uridylyltransferase [Rhodocyclaceae bacterium]